MFNVRKLTKFYFEVEVNGSYVFGFYFKDELKVINFDEVTDPGEIFDTIKDDLVKYILKANVW